MDLDVSEEEAERSAAAVQNSRAARGQHEPLMVCLFTVQPGSGRALNAYFPPEILNALFSFSEAWGKIMFNILKINTAFTGV